MDEQLSHVYCGDAIEMMQTLPSASVDACITDPPYGVTACKWDAVIPFEPMWEQLQRIVTGATLLFGQPPFSSALIMSNPTLFKYDWIWEKTTASGHLNAKKAPMRAHETINVFYNKLPTYNPQKTSGHVRKTARAERFRLQSECYGKQDGITFYDSTERYPRSVIEFSTDKQFSKLHPTQKPLELMRYLVRTYTNAGDTVLDFACGSGTTGVACVLEGRKFIGFDNEAKYVEIAKRRIADVLELAA